MNTVSTLTTDTVMISIGISNDALIPVTTGMLGSSVTRIAAIPV